MTAEDIRRMQRIARERADGTYFESGETKLRALIATRDARRATEANARLRGLGRNQRCPCGSGRKAKYCCMS